MKIFLKIIITTTLLTAALSQAEETMPEYDHFQGKEVANLKEAVMLFSQLNAKIAVILNKGEPTYEDMHKIHEMTYTLENALAKINTEMAALAPQLEKLHKASEHGKIKESLYEGQKYLGIATHIIP
ncbi:DUF6746 family protein [Marinagarivorans algicola]|uniref:DUF6746 family protein n=1 Tax=Marinagarivorans algicola TaxID=1513270 RepID=UPI0006B9CAA9|nr:DUF6746 family protein [Marinagarivorans algicola]